MKKVILLLLFIPLLYSCGGNKVETINGLESGYYNTDGRITIENPKIPLSYPAVDIECKYEGAILLKVMEINKQYYRATIKYNGTIIIDIPCLEHVSLLTINYKLECKN